MCMCCLGAGCSDAHRLLLPLLLVMPWCWLHAGAQAPACEKGTKKPRRLAARTAAAARPCCNKALRILVAILRPDTALSFMDSIPSMVPHSKGCCCS